MKPGGGAPWDVVVAGAGPAGLLAAGRAAQLGARVLLLEKMEKPARKLRITGKGRANITNMKGLEEHLQEIQPESRFLREAYAAFFNADLVALLEGQGVPTKTERGGRVFPASDRAWDVAEALAGWTRAQGVDLWLHARLESLEIRDGALAALEVARGAEGALTRLEPACLILATGGQSYPRTGSTGDGYRLAEACGHRIAPLRPSLVSLETRPAYPKAQGLTVRNVELSLWVDGRKQGSAFGEAEFTPKGLGGPIVLRLSRKVVDALAARRAVRLTLDLKPALDPAKLEARIQREREALGSAPALQLLRKLLPAPLPGIFAKAIGLEPGAGPAQLQGSRLKRLLELLKAFPFEVTGHGGWEEAIVTAGGVSLKDVDPRTLASRRVRGLFFAGELLDLDANTGGYNLQIAFSTGWLAGSSAARQAGAPGSSRPLA